MRVRGTCFECGAVAEDKLSTLATAFWLLAGHRLITTPREKPSRATRRRARREIQTVVVFALRRRSYPETDGTRHVDWSHRWWVRGHWRHQWYPSQQRHKPKWIADHPKGPPDKPLVIKQRAFEVKR